MTVREAFAAQVEACAGLGSPFMARLMALITERLASGRPVFDAMLNWQGDPSPNADNVPLRFAGALHALKLADKALREVYPPNAATDDVLWDAVLRAAVDHEAHVLSWLDIPPQTNEVRRAAAILPTLATLHARDPRPVALYELGASGGLNLRADRFCLNTPGGVIGDAGSPVVLAPEWTGATPPLALPEVIARKGVDLNPIDPTTDEGRIRLLSYLWPDQTDRIERTSSAIEIARRVPAKVSQGDAADWLQTALEDHPEGAIAVIFHTVAWQYFDRRTREGVERAIAQTHHPVAHVAMEWDGGKGAALDQSAPGDTEPTLLARVDFHGRWVDWLAR